MKELIDCPSPSGEENGAIDFLIRKGEEFGLSLEKRRVGRRSNIIATSSKRPKLLLCSHIDTVPMEAAKIKQSRIDSDSVFGLGACDAKGSVTSMFFALSCLAKKRKEIAEQVSFAIFVGEEESGDGGLSYVRDGNRPKYAIVGEPTNLRLPWGQAGYIHLKISSWCEPRHAFYDHKQDSMDQILSSIEIIRNEINRRSDNLPLAERPNLFIQWINGGSEDRFWYSRHQCSASVIINIHPKWDPTQFIRSIKRQVEFRDDTSNISMSVLSWDPGFEFSSSKLRAVVSNSLVRQNFYSEQREYMRSWTDAATLEWRGIKTVVIGPGDLRYAHSPNEFVRIEDLRVAMQLYYDSAIGVITDRVDP